MGGDWLEVIGVRLLVGGDWWKVIGGWLMVVVADGGGW